MANKKTNEEDGVWRTIGGRRVFIRNGQSLADAMKESGKFSNLNKNVSSHKHPSEVKKEEKKKDDYTKETDPEKRLKNVYMMDRVLRSMNNEEALDDGWLMNGVADGDTDNGWEVFKEDNWDGKDDYGFYVEDEAYNDMVNMYQDLVKKYAKDGVLTRDWFKSHEGNWKSLAGVNDEELAFLKQDVPDVEVMGESKPFMTKVEKENYADLSKQFTKENYDALDMGSDDYKKSLNNYMNEHGELGGIQGNMLVYNSDENEFYKAKLEHDKKYKEEEENKNRYEQAKKAFNEMHEDTRNSFPISAMNDEQAEEQLRLWQKAIDDKNVPDYQKEAYAQDIKDLEKELERRQEVKELLKPKDGDITDFKHQLTQAESDYYNNLSPNEVYELGMKLTEQRALDERQMNIKDEANKLLDSIDRANKKGSGYADKQTEKLRELLKSSKDMLDEEPKFTQKQIDAMDRLANQAKEGARSDIKDFLSGKENYDGNREDFIKDVADEWGLDKNEVEDMLHDENAKHPRNFKNVPSKEQQKQMTESFKSAKDKAFKDMKDAENAWLESYNNADWNNENWRVQDKELSQKRDETREAYNKAMKNYLDNANEEDLSWLDKVARNDFKQEEELAKYNDGRHEDDYYEVFRKYERENAKLKAEGAKPEDEYVPLNSWGSFHNKMEELTKDNDNAKWTGKEYTNDEFMEHLEDANWHTERRMLETAGLTNQEMEYIKDHTTLAAYSADLDRDKTQKLINEAKDKYRKPKTTNEIMNNNIREKASKKFDYTKRYSPKELTKLSDKELEGLKNTHNALYDEYSHKEKPSDLRTKNGRLENTFNKSMTANYKASNDDIDKEITRRGLNYDKGMGKLRTADDAVVENNYQRYSGTIDYLKEIGLSSSQISQIIDKMKKDDYNKK